jgi:hypothetical protein
MQIRKETTIQPAYTCYTTTMKKRDNAKDEPTLTPAQIWRERLNQAKQPAGSKKAAGITGSAGKQSDFKKTTPGNSTRKSRKGLRPG